MVRINKRNYLVLLLLIVSLTLIGIGIYMSHLSSPKRIITKAMKNLSNTIYLSKTEDKDLSQGNVLLKKDGFTINSMVSLKTNSQYLVDKSESNPEYLKYANLLKNISNTENTINFVQDNKNKKLLLNINSNLYNQPLINMKYYIQDATEYYYIDGFKDTYINNGNNNYFEIPYSDNITGTGIKYLFDFIKKSFKDNFREEYLKMEKEELTIDNVTQDYYKVSLILNNKVLKEIINSLQKDLKKDKMTAQILMILNCNLKIDSKTRIIPDDESIIFSVYTDKLTYKIRRYELIFKKNNSNIKIVYSLDNKGYVIKDNEVIYNYTITKNDSSTKINILSKENISVGSITFNKTSVSYEIELSFNNDNINAIGNYKLEHKTKKDNYAYEFLNQLNLRVVNKKTELINLNYTIDTNFLYQSEILEDVSTSVFQSSITDFEKEMLVNYNLEKINKLYQ